MAVLLGLTSIMMIFAAAEAAADGNYVGAALVILGYLALVIVLTQA
jgi:hypothetical protein